MAPKKKHWMQDAVEHPGALHRALGVPEGQKIPAKKLSEALHSDSEHIRRMAQLAKTFRKY